jgi:hypothetical protein
VEFLAFRKPKTEGERMQRIMRRVGACWLLLMGVLVLVTEAMMAFGYPPLDGFNPLTWVAVVLEPTFPIPMILMAVAGVVLGIIELRRSRKSQ